jgi:hypothetical protein
MKTITALKSYKNQGKEDMQELRNSPRKVADQILLVSDQITGTPIGRVVNISAEGFMLLSEEPVITGSIYQLNLTEPQCTKKENPIRFSAEAVWSAEASQPDSYWSGFHIIDIDSADILYINELTLQWQTK